MESVHLPAAVPVILRSLAPKVSRAIAAPVRGIRAGRALRAVGQATCKRVANANAKFNAGNAASRAAVFTHSELVIPR